MIKKLKLGIVFGGKSGEHEVSVRSAASVYKALDKNKYEVCLIGIDKNGRWHMVNQKWLPEKTEMKALVSGDKQIEMFEVGQQIDVVIPLVHGTYGEDGSLQGLFEIMDIAYVGAGVLGSVVGMDKDVQKRLLKESGVKVADYIALKSNAEFPAAESVKYPVFVKPANMGSSVGVSKVHNYSEVVKAVKFAFQFDTKVIIEEFVEGRELEVSVLGSDEPSASVAGEIIPKNHEFYDYESKYIDENGVKLEIPARIPAEKMKEIQNLAVKAFRVLECEGMARVDFFMRPNGDLLVNEINTIPGFTNISMYPKLWQESGLMYSDLLDRLIELAIQRKRKQNQLKRTPR